MDTKLQEQRAHQVTLTEREQLTVTGVLEVLSFDESEVLLTTPHGKLLIRGQGLQVLKTDVQSGQVAVMGTVSELLYSNPIQGHGGHGLFGRLFGS